MPARVRIYCINKTDRYNPWERIKNVGGLNADGSRWKLSLAEAIAGVRTRKWDFYTVANGSHAEVIVATKNGHPYLKTEADGEMPNNLLSLPECPD